MAKPYRQGDRVRIRGPLGVTGRVVDVIRHSNPAWLGYLVDLGEGRQVEIPAYLAAEPHRYLLAQWRRWSAKDLGIDFIAWLTDEQLTQLQAEYLEENPRARTGPRSRFVPHRISGFEPLHLVEIAKTSERYETTKSNGSCRRTRVRHWWWVRCACGFCACVDSAADARRTKETHEGVSTHA